jgi:hypothetical protein
MLLADVSAVLSRENEPLTENGEYMQLTELKFLTAIQLLQSYSRSETVTCREFAESSNATVRTSSAKKSKGSAGHVSGNTDEAIGNFRTISSASKAKENKERVSLD